MQSNYRWQQEWGQKEEGIRGGGVAWQGRNVCAEIQRAFGPAGLLLTTLCSQRAPARAAKTNRNRGADVYLPLWRHLLRLAVVTLLTSLGSSPLCCAGKSFIHIFMDLDTVMTSRVMLVAPNYVLFLRSMISVTHTHMKDFNSMHTHIQTHTLYS